MRYLSQMILFLAVISLAAYQYLENQTMKDEFAAKIASIQGENQTPQMIYVYSLEEAMVGINAAEEKNKFEQEALRLSDEVTAAEEKIMSLKDKEVQEDFSDVYLNSLRLKRDNLVEEYHKMLEDLSNKVNKSLEEIAAEKKASTIFLKSMIAVNTPYVVDVTPELIAKLKK